MGRIYYSYEYKLNYELNELLIIEITYVNEKTKNIMIENQIDYDNIKYLNFGDHLDINRLPKLPNELKCLIICNNNIDILPELPYNLEELFCINNHINELPNLPKCLRRLHCENNKLIEIPELPDSLTELNINSNKVSVIPNLGSKLEKLFCKRNMIKSVSETFPDSIIELDLSFNLIEEINNFPESSEHIRINNNSDLCKLPNKLPINLKKFDLNNTKIKSLPLIPSKLIYINCCCTELNNVPDTCNLNSRLNIELNNYNYTPIYYTICRKYDRNIYKYLFQLLIKQKKKVNFIGDWFLKCKYDPNYKYCRKRLLNEYNEISEQKEFNKLQKKRKIK